MAEGLSREAGKVGLEPNASKTKIISNRDGENLIVGGKTVELAINLQ